MLQTLSKPLLVVAVLSVCFFGGMALGTHNTTQYYKRVIAEKEKETALSYAEKEQAYSDRLTQVVDELNRANRSLVDRSADLERLRNANTRLQARLKATAPNPDREALARCSALLTEGAGLVAESERLLLDHSARHDALVNLKEGIK